MRKSKSWFLMKIAWNFEILSTDLSKKVRVPTHASYDGKASLMIVGNRTNILELFTRLKGLRTTWSVSHLIARPPGTGSKFWKNHTKVEKSKKPSAPQKRYKTCFSMFKRCLKTIEVVFKIFREFFKKSFRHQNHDFHKNAPK